MNPETEVIYRVWADGHCIEVGDYADAPNYLELRTEGENAEYFGQIRVSMSPEFCIALGRALIAAGEAKATGAA